jgi:hypothetical protein
MYIQEWLSFQAPAGLISQRQICLQVWQQESKCLLQPSEDMRFAFTAQHLVAVICVLLPHKQHCQSV